MTGFWPLPVTDGAEGAWELCRTCGDIVLRTGVTESSVREDLSKDFGRSGRATILVSLQEGGSDCCWKIKLVLSPLYSCDSE